MLQVPANRRGEEQYPLHHQLPLEMIPEGVSINSYKVMKAQERRKEIEDHEIQRKQQEFYYKPIQ